MNVYDTYCRAEHLDARFSLKGTTPSYAPDRTFDTQHIKLAIDIDFASVSFRGHCETTLKTLVDAQTSLYLDAVNFTIFSVQWNGRKIPYRYDQKKITLLLPMSPKRGSINTISVDYKVTQPTLGLTFIKPNKAYPNNPTQVWTQGEDEYARYWFPCVDMPGERTTTEILATVPKGFKAVSNGRLVGVRKKGTKWIYHWKQTIPHATYLVTLTVGKFSEIKESWRGKPVLYFCEKGRENDALRAFGKTPKMLEYFSSKIGVAYPYEKYAQVAAHDFIYGGMENTSATTQTEYALLDECAALDSSSDELVAHELAHQWFGDYLTCKSWDHAWLNESFATYFDALFKRFDKGEDEYQYQLFQNGREYFNEDKDRYRRPIVTNLFRRPSDLFDRHLYEKGSLVLKMLHHELGELLFWKVIRTYVENNAADVVETSDFIDAIEQTTGRNMRRFFDQWVFGAGHPEYKIRMWWNTRTKKAVFRIVQTNAELRVFHVKTDLLLKCGNKEIRKTVTLDQKSHLIEISLPEAPSFALFDPDHKILKKVHFVRTQDQLINQLFESKNPLNRIEAAHELALLGSDVAVDALFEALKSDFFWGVRVEVAKALGSVRREEVALLLLSALDQIPHHKVRRALYVALKSMTGQNVAREIARRLPQEQSYFVAGEALSALVALRAPKALSMAHEFLKQDSWNDIKRICALDALSQLKDPALIPLFMRYTKPGHHQRTRMAAVRALMVCGASHSLVQKRLTELLQDPFVLLKNMAIRALQSVGDERAVPALRKLTLGDQDGRTMRLAEEALENLMKGIDEKPARSKQDYPLGRKGSSRKI